MLDTNNIGDEGAEALAKLLIANPAITSLNISGNNVGDKGAIALGEMLKVGPPARQP